MESGRGDCIFEANRTFQSKLHNFFPPFSRLLLVLLDQFFDEVYLPRTRIWAINTRFDVIAIATLQSELYDSFAPLNQLVLD